MTLAEYLRELDRTVAAEPEQVAWYGRLRAQARAGTALVERASASERDGLVAELAARVRTEELKAWYSAPEGPTLFQGTSVTSLTIPCELPNPLGAESIESVEAAAAEHYVRLHDEHEASVRGAILEDVTDWLHQGLFYGLAVPSKLLSQAFGLSVPVDDVVCRVAGHLIDPHEIIASPAEVREAYFSEVTRRLDCFEGLDVRREELEASLILADISKPRLEQYRSRLLLAPIRCNEIAALFARRLAQRIRRLTDGRISPSSLAVVIYDTDTPYTYHHLLGCNGDPLAPVLPGLTVLGSSGTIDAFRWLYAYRVSLIAQKMQKGSLYSEVHRRYIPFVYYGVLVPRDAAILLDLTRLDRLRYRGNLSPRLEFACLLPSLDEYRHRDTNPVPIDDLIDRYVR